MRFHVGKYIIYSHKVSKETQTPHLVGTFNSTHVVSETGATQGKVVIKLLAWHHRQTPQNSYDYYCTVENVDGYFKAGKLQSTTNQCQRTELSDAGQHYKKDIRKSASWNPSALTTSEENKPPARLLSRQ